MTDIEILPLLKDNYAFLLTGNGDGGGDAAVIDPSDAAPVIAALEERGLTLRAILNTHHHGDHTGGNLALKEKYGCPVYGPAAEAGRIPGLDRGLKEGDVLEIAGLQVKVMETPGHTAGHICFFLPGLSPPALFCGDTLFSLGCGRLLEGTAAQMWDSLQKIAALPDETAVYCGHEYTLANGRFCLAMEPHNQALSKILEDAEKMRRAAKPTIPSTIGLEKKTNVFLRADGVKQFAALRAAKDEFR